MAVLTVKLQPDSVAYDPNDNTVKPGDTVNFQRDGRSDEIIVTFPNGSPFSTSTITVGTALTESPHSILTNAAVQPYSFYFNEEASKEHDPEPPGTVPGELDVVDDWIKK